MIAACKQAVGVLRKHRVCNKWCSDHSFVHCRFARSSSSSTTRSPGACSSASMQAATPATPAQAAAHHHHPPTMFLEECGTGELVRDHISQALYNKNFGYFNTFDIIHSPPQVEFSDLAGQEAWTEKLAELYGAKPDGWLTPVELFQPWYAQAVLRWMLRVRSEQAIARTSSAAPLHIVEVGGGMGTAAKNILDYLSEREPELYADVQYTIIEASAALAATQKKVLAGHMTGDEKGGSRCVRTVQVEAQNWKEHYPHDCFVFGLEVLDNMSHDKVAVVDEMYMQAHVVKEKDHKDARLEMAEDYRDVTDPWIARYLEIMSTFDPSAVAEQSGKAGRRNTFEKLRDSAISAREAFHNSLLGLMHMYDDNGPVTDHTFVPTVCLQFLHVLRDHFPRHHLFLADFDYLPGATAGINGPVVAHKSQASGGRTQDLSSYLTGKGTVDIFFPTDFAALQHMYREVCGRSASTPKQGKWLEQYAEHQHTVTQDGFNPLLEDYANMRVLVGDDFIQRE